MSLYNRLDVFIKENSFNTVDYNYTKLTIGEYLRNGKVSWNNLTLNMQELLIEFEKTEKITGLVPKNAQLNHYLFL